MTLLRRLLPYLAILGGVAAVLFVVYLKGRADMDAVWQLREATALRHQLEQQIEADRQDAVRRAAQEQILAGYQAQIQRLSDALQDPARACFVGPDADRLRALWQ